MYKITILYADAEGKHFDMDYYEKNHMPMMAGFIGDNLYFYEIDKGISGRNAAEKAPYVAVGYFFIKDTLAYNKAIAANIDAVRADIPKYTNIQPAIQVSEIRVVAAGKNK